MNLLEEQSFQINYNFGNDNLKVDDIDIKILKLIQEDPDMTHSDIAKIINKSQPTVGMRLKKLKDSGILQIQAGINFKNSEIYLVVAHLKVKNANNILEIAKTCPFMLNAFKLSGEYNVSILLASRNIRQLYDVINHHFRANLEVQKVSMDLIIEIAKDFVLPMTFDSETLIPSLESEYSSNFECCKTS